MPRSIPPRLRLMLAMGSALCLGAATPSSPGSAHYPMVAFGDLEVPVTAVGRLPERSQAGPVVINLVVDELPLDHLTRAPGRGASAGASAGAAVGASASVVRPDASNQRVATARNAVASLREFQPVHHFALWIAHGENDISDLVECPRTRIFGAQGVGKVTLQVVCLGATVRDVRGGSLNRNWGGDTAGIPPGPVRLEFTPGGTTLSPAEIARLKAILALLALKEKLSVVVAGYAEVDEGDPDDIASRRAAAVRDHFIAAGVSASRVLAVSYGRERPLERDANDTPWALNRSAHVSIVSGATRD